MPIAVVKYYDYVLQDSFLRAIKNTPLDYDKAKEGGVVVRIIQFVLDYICCYHNRGKLFLLFICTNI